MKTKTRILRLLAVAFCLTAIGFKAEAGAKAKGTLSGQVNINEASLAELTLLPGVGTKRAQAIQEYAKAHPFKSAEELKNIKGIGDKGLLKLKPFVTLSGPTTAKFVKTAQVLPPPSQQ